MKQLDGNTAALNKHLEELDAFEQFDDMVIEESARMFDEFTGRAGAIVKVGRNNYSIDDFLSDFEGDAMLYVDLINGNGKKLGELMHEKLNDWCIELAEKKIKGGE